MPAEEDRNWMRALRIGYLRACVFFSDENLDGSISFDEISQPSGPKGLVGLYVQGESTSTTSPIRQDVFDVACSDTLTGKKNMTLLFQAGSGLNFCLFSAVSCTIDHYPLLLIVAYLSHSGILIGISLHALQSLMCKGARLHVFRAHRSCRVSTN